MHGAGTNQKQPSPNCYNRELRDIIAWRIATERRRMFPDRGGLGKCARAFGTSDQQWSQYENGRRTPDDGRLGEIAAFFSVSLEHLKTAPENWESVRREWLGRIKPGRKEAAWIEPVSSAPAASQEERPEAEGHPDAVSPAGIPVVELIQKIIDFENMHERGEISASVYRQTKGAVDSLIGLALKRNSRPMQ